jgi:hypothetical protein
VSRPPDADLFSAGRTAHALALAAFGGRGFCYPVRQPQADGSWLGDMTAVARADLRLVEVPYTSGGGRDARLAALRALESAEGRESAEGSSASSSASVSSNASIEAVVPIPIGEPQGLDTLAFFAACRMACPRAHVIADLDLLGLKLGQLCLAFGADAIMGAIVKQRELRLGARAGSHELTADEAAALLRAAGFEPCERHTGEEVRVP